MLRRMVLSGPADVEGFRRQARVALAAGLAPDALVWTVGDDGADLLAGQEGGAPADASAGRSAPRVSRSFMAMAEAALIHADPARFGLVYRILWRLGDEPGLTALASDPDMVRLGRMAKAVRRDIHKMHAFVRFRAVAGGAPDGSDAYVAWYEPDHHVVEAAAPFFARRFASLAWTILTPRRSVAWTAEGLVFGPGARPSEAPPEDRWESLWLAYYASIFNPARLNPEAMRAEMPVRFWHNLPEASLIRGLVADAPARSARMVAAAPTLPVLRRGAALAASVSQDGADPGGVPPSPAMAGATLAGCRACPLWEQATQAVPGEGPAQARLMLVGEQPGDREDIAGRPFVGPAGGVLDRALERAGLSRQSVYLTNAVKHFKFSPRGKRRLHKRPDAAEIQACLPWLDREMAAVDPAVVVMLGASAAQAVLGGAVKVTCERGAVLSLPGGRRGLVTVHPSYVLRLTDSPEAGRAFELLVSDLRLAATLEQNLRSLEPMPGDRRADHCG